MDNETHETDARQQDLNEIYEHISTETEEARLDYEAWKREQAEAYRLMYGPYWTW